MEVVREKMTIRVLFRGKTYVVDMPVDATVGELGKQMSHMTGVTLLNMKLLVPPRGGFRATALLPASSNQQSLLLFNNSGFSVDTGTLIRMSGALPEEIREVSETCNKQVGSRIIGFEEEDQRAKLRAVRDGKRTSSLPSGPYTFSAFRTLQLPGVELNPPPAQALAVLHKLASDPGIVAIMKTHRWQVGVMTELAPVGYVGVSPKCLLGFNKNRGEEISLRLRTDDLQGFRKYESIKKTLLHELAHMVHDEHDEKFNALDKQLNQEAVSLDWTKGTGGHTLNTTKNYVEDSDAPMDTGGVKTGHKLGGISTSPHEVRRAAAEAALLRTEKNRLELVGSENAVSEKSKPSTGKLEPDPDDSLDSMDYDMTKVLSAAGQQGYSELDEDDTSTAIVVIAEGQLTADESVIKDVDEIKSGRAEPDPDEAALKGKEPDPDESGPHDLVDKAERYTDRYQQVLTEKYEPDPDELRAEPDPDESHIPMVTQDNIACVGNIQEPDPDEGLCTASSYEEPDPDEALMSIHKDQEPDPDEALMSIHKDQEPDPDEALMSIHKDQEPDPDEVLMSIHKDQEPDPDEALISIHKDQEPDPDEGIESGRGEFNSQGMDIDVVDDELVRIQNATSGILSRLQSAIATLKKQASPADTTVAIQTLFTILRNVTEHPNEDRYRRLRKGNSNFQHRVAKYEGAVEVLRLVGFSDGVQSASDSDCLVLKSSDPGLLWLARASLEASLA
jgi:hypothetical protein